jgi:hypothetical protein
VSATPQSRSRGKDAPAGRLAAYTRQAERFGTELVFERASGLVWPFRPELRTRELGYLALRLRNLDPKWQLPKGENDRPYRDVDGLLKSPGGFEVQRLDGADFALMLVAEGVDERDACRMAGVSRRTVQRRQRPARDLLRNVPEDAKWRAEPAFQSGEIATNPGSEGYGSSGPEMSLVGAGARP